MNDQYVRGEVETITPELAADLLSRNMKNRPVSQQRVRKYMAAMVAGKWLLNGEAIKISIDGRLIDGQHRLKAIIQANRTVRMMVVRGLSNDVIPTLDTGKVRTAGDVLAISGGVSSTEARVLAGAVRTLILYEKSDNWLAGSGGSNQYLNDNSDVDAYVKTHAQELNENLQWLLDNMPKQNAVLTSSDRLFFYTIFARIDQNFAKDFALQIFKGVGLPETGTAYFLREYLTRAKAKLIAASTGRQRHTIIKCWNSMRAGRDIKHNGNIAPRQEDAIHAK